MNVNDVSHVTCYVTYISYWPQCVINTLVILVISRTGLWGIWNVNDVSHVTCYVTYISYWPQCVINTLVILVISRTGLWGIWISIIKLRRPWDRLSFIMRISTCILVRRHLYIHWNGPDVSWVKVGTAAMYYSKTCVRRPLNVLVCQDRWSFTTGGIGMIL